MDSTVKCTVNAQHVSHLKKYTLIEHNIKYKNIYLYTFIFVFIFTKIPLDVGDVA